MDKFASDTAHYTEGAFLLADTSRISKSWVPHYMALEGYPARSLLASGTHGDNNPTNGTRAPEFSKSLIDYNRLPGAGRPRLVNAALPMFFDALESEHPTLPSLRGDFGDSWDVWPVTLAAYASKARIGERAYLAAESLLALAPEGGAQTADERRTAERDWIMLADHAWNGTDDDNRHVNANLRHGWGDELEKLANDLTDKGWSAAGLAPDLSHITVFNPISVPRADLVRVPVPANVSGVSWQGKPLASQVLSEDGQRMLYFVSPPIAGFGFASFTLTAKPFRQRGIGHSCDWIRTRKPLVSHCDRPRLGWNREPDRERDRQGFRLIRKWTHFRSNDLPRSIRPRDLAGESQGRGPGSGIGSPPRRRRPRWDRGC